MTVTAPSNETSDMRAPQQVIESNDSRAPFVMNEYELVKQHNPYLSIEGRDMKSYPVLIVASDALAQHPVEGRPEQGEIAGRIEGDFMIFYNWMGEEVRIRHTAAKISGG